MDRRHFLYAMGLVGARASGTLPARAQSGRTVTQICDGFLESYIRINPTLMGRVFGLNRSGGAVSNWSPAGVNNAATLMRDTLGALGKTSAVNRKEHLGGAFLEDTAQSILATIDAGESWRKMSTHIFIGPPALLLTSFELMSKSKRAEEALAADVGGEVPLSPEAGKEDWDRILERMRAVPKAMAGYRESLEVGLSRNLMAPRSMTLAVAKQCRDWAASGWFASFVRDYGSGALAEPLAKAATAADKAYGELAEWLTATYAPKASLQDGLGGERYALYLDLWLGLKKLDLDEAYNWAVAEYLNLEKEKAKECARIRPGAGYDDIRLELDTDPAQTINGVDAFRAWVQGKIDAAISKLNGAEFDLPAQMRTCNVQMITNGAGAMPYYVMPAEDFSTPGGVAWPTLGKTVLPSWSALSTVYHESVPGHHIQLGGARLLDLTRLQRVAGASGHAEGWALYAERLADELGWFDTPRTRLGFLSMQAFRAARVIVDIGLHTGRKIPAGLDGAGEVWTADRAITLIDKSSGLGRGAAAMEVERYYAWPGQACSYKLGERTWLSCRADAMARAGSGFNRKQWHAKALALGPLGLDRLASELKLI